jgi:hypothetical protein
MTGSSDRAGRGLAGGGLRPARGLPARVALAAACALTIGLSGLQRAQADEALDIDPNADFIKRFTGPRWSMIVPDKDYEGGCVVGFLAFAFSPTGYFTFNNRIRGSWRLDELGNLKLRTRDGVLFTMLVDGRTMRSSKTITFLSRTMIFERCPE